MDNSTHHACSRTDLRLQSPTLAQSGATMRTVRQLTMVMVLGAWTSLAPACGFGTMSEVEPKRIRDEVAAAGVGGAAADAGVDAAVVADPEDDASVPHHERPDDELETLVAGHDAPAAGSGGGPEDAGCTKRTTAGEPQLMATELGALVVPEELDQVAAGPGALVEDRFMWLLGTRPQGPFQGRWVAVTADPDDLRQQPPRLDPKVSAQLLFPDATIDMATAMAPTSAWSGEDHHSLQYFFSHYYILAPTGVGLGESTLQKAPATILRDLDMVFIPAADMTAKSAAARPKLMSAVTVRSGVAYAYVCQALPGVSAETDSDGAHYQPCRVARVPSQLMGDGARYQFWDGKQWQLDFERSAPVLDHIVSGLSVEYNTYLDKYLAVFSDENNTLVVQSADAPQGPFEPLTRIFTVTGSGGPFPFSHSGRELLGLRQACDRRLYLAYVVPLQDSADSSTVRSETHIVRLALD